MSDALEHAFNAASSNALATIDKDDDLRTRGFNFASVLFEQTGNHETWRKYAALHVRDHSHCA
ncbi:hypothetical protein X948_4964 [Burkholderia pseudomallei MSHR5608]|nr:hypothetical protein X948_4964 [Burkholderia pseudomallei MSHR5608]